MFYIALMLFQSVAPAAFLVTPAYAATETEVVQATVSNVTLNFVPKENTFVLAGTASRSAEYVLSYSDGKTSKKEAIMGVVAGDFSEKLYAGTCSGEECIAHPVSTGALTFTGTNYNATFEIIDGVTWLTEGKKATVATVSKDVKYVAPQYGEVAVIFTKLPENPGSLTIEEITLSDEQVKKLGAYSNVAYDITSNMPNGSFEYTLQLPLPEGADENSQLVYAENVAELDNAQKIQSSEVVSETMVAEGLDHFTVFVVTFEDPQDPTPASPGYNDYWFNFGGGTISQVPSGTNGIVSASGDNHAEITGPVFTRWGGYNNTFPINGYDTSVDVYLDMALADGSSDLRFDFSSAINTPTGDHRRDFIIHLGTNPTVAGEWLASASNNAPGSPGDPALSPVSITESGWYTLAHSFRDNGSGILEVTISLIKKGEAVPVGTWVRSDVSDIIGTTVGGNRYGWFTSQRFDFDWLAIDNAAIDDLVDTTPPATPTGLRRLGLDGNIYQCGDFSIRQNMVPMWDANTEPDLDHYEYSSFHSNGSQGLNEQVLTVPELANTWVAPTDGTYGFAVRAVDTAGNKSDWALSEESLAGSCQITYDSTIPTQPTIIKPTAEQYFTATPILNEWTAATDAGSGVDRYQIAYLYDDLHTFGGSTCPGVQIDGQTLSGCRDVDGLTRNHTPALSEQGGVTIWVRAIDTVGNVGEWSDSVHYFYDATAPVAPELVSPPNNSVVNGASITQSWSTTDTDVHHYIYESYNDAGATSLRWHEEIAATSKTATNVGEATYWWRVRAVDHAGNVGPWSPLWKITVDNTAPLVSITAPAHNGFVAGVTDFRGTVIDDNLWRYYYNISSVTSATVYSDTGFTDQSVYSWNTELVADGDYYLRLEARDKAQNKDGGSVAVIKVTVDNNVETPVITAPSEGQYFNTSPIRAEWNAVSDASGIEKYEIKYEYLVSGVPTTAYREVAGNVLYRDQILSGAVQGAFTIQVRAYDNLGNVSEWSDSVTYIYDTINPVSTITTYGLSNGGEVLTNTFPGLIEGTATDENSGVAEVNLEIMYTPFGSSDSVYWNDATQEWQIGAVLVPAVGTDAWSYQLPPEFIGDGTYQITSHATDNAGNVETTYTITVMYDATLPEAAVAVSPETPDGENGWYRAFEPTITLTGSDNYLLDRVEYQWNGTGGAWVTYSDPLNPPAQGVNVLYYRSVDAASNTSEVGQKEVKYDNTNPGEALSVRVENITGTDADGKWSAPTDDSDVDTYRLSWKHEDGSEYGAVVSRTTFERKLDNLKNGLWTFSVRATDLAGNFSEKKVDFRVGPAPSDGSGNTESSEESVLGVTDENTTQGAFGTGGVLGSQTIALESVETETEEEATQEEAVAEEAGLVMGVSTCSPWVYYLPLLLLLLQALSLIAFELLFRGPGLYKVFVTIAVTLAFGGLFYLLGNPECYLAGSWLAVIARWFTWLALLTGGVVKLIGYGFIEEA